MNPTIDHYLNSIAQMATELRQAYAAIEEDLKTANSEKSSAIQRWYQFRRFIVARREEFAALPSDCVTFEVAELERLIASIEAGNMDTGVPVLKIPKDHAVAFADLRRLHSILHRLEAHPDFEYATTKGPRKNWNGQVPEGDGWEKNTDKNGGWERFDFHEEEYYRRLKPPQTPA